MTLEMFGGTCGGGKRWAQRQRVMLHFAFRPKTPVLIATMKGIVTITSMEQYDEMFGFSSGNQNT